MPLVNVDAMRQAYFRAGAAYNDCIFWSNPNTWMNQTTTPNHSTSYVMFINLRNGPVVIDVPAATEQALYGTIINAWNGPLLNVGNTGYDKGVGAPYLVLPPGFDGEMPAVLANRVGEETVQDRDLALLGQLNSLGIGKGLTFNPNAFEDGLLYRAVDEAHEWMMGGYATNGTPIWPDKNRQWCFLLDIPLAEGTRVTFVEPGKDLRVDVWAFAWFAMFGPVVPPPPQLYVKTYETKTGERRNGARTDRLQVPADVPSSQFWAVDVYDAAAAPFIRESPVVGLDSNAALRSGWHSTTFWKPGRPTPNTACTTAAFMAAGTCLRRQLAHQRSRGTVVNTDPYSFEQGHPAAEASSRAYDADLVRDHRLRVPLPHRLRCADRQGERGRQRVRWLVERLLGGQ